MSVADLPHLNAALNAATFVLLCAGWACVRRKQVAAHRACMLAALGTAALFLISYVIYHYGAGATPFAGRGWIRPVYFFVLATHTVLAAAVLPMAVVTARRGLLRRIEKHRALARWTLPVWIYVSVTGLLVYALLYHLHPAPG